MKKIVTLATMVASFGLMTFAFAAPTTVRGYVLDKGCASPSKIAKMKGNEECAQSCVKKGSPAVFVQDRTGKVLTIANQDKVMDVLGDHVTLTGEVADGAITVDTAKKLPARKKAATK